MTNQGTKNKTIESLIFDNRKIFFLFFRKRFYELYNHAIDEVWYTRAVEQHAVEQQSFVFSVPFNVDDADNALVTASHAIFLSEDGRSAPAGVVGYQFQHSALYKLFKNITSKVRNTVFRHEKVHD